MAANWKHPKLGEFTSDGNGWYANVKVPAFKGFSYDTGYSNARRSTGKCTLALRWFMRPNEDEPTPRMVELAEKVMADPRGLVAKMTAALWEDFNGRGPDSGMWWHGDMETINRSFKADKLPPPTGPDDLLPALQLTNVIVWDEVFDHPEPIVDLTFHAAFEEEHGVSILTDGDEILGAGYASDATPWKRTKAKRTKKQ